jgi:hypothetical protein
VEKKDPKDVDVTFDDQKKINAFGRANNRLQEVVDQIKELEVLFLLCFSSIPVFAHPLSLFCRFPPSTERHRWYERC